MSADDEMTRKGNNDDLALRELLDQMPIFATRVGYRSNSTEDQRAFAEFLWGIHRQWTDWKAVR